MWDEAKTVLWTKFIELNAYVRKIKKSKQPSQETTEQNTTKTSRRKDIIKIRREISEIKNRKITEKKTII